MTLRQGLKTWEKLSAALPDEIHGELSQLGSNPIQQALTLDELLAAGSPTAQTMNEALNTLNIGKSVWLVPKGLTPAADIAAGLIGATGAATAEAMDYYGPRK